ncbi:MAG TPA: hypothetical protein V6C46_05210 [Coleofasciculaceae cyanobacterium]
MSGIIKRVMHMETMSWMDGVAAGFAVVILAGGLFILVSGAWSARDK